MTLTKIILDDLRPYYADKVKPALMKACCILANRYHEPTMENLQHPNSKVWLEIMDRFLEHEDNPGRLPLFKAIKKVFVDQHETDPYYRDRIQAMLELWLEEVLNGNWQPRPEGYPQDCWRSDYRGKGYEFIKKCYEEAHNGR